MTVVSAIPTDLQDERIRSDAGLRGAARASLGRVRDGDLGLLPVIAGLILIWTIFQILNPVFLSPANLSNLLMESAPVGVIALGIVFVLLVGEIDLSVGSVSGLASAILAVTYVNSGLPLALGILLAVVTAAVIGWLYAQAYSRIGVPSFVITLAGLLAFLGLQLYVLGPNGTINIPFTSPLVLLGQLLYVPNWLAYVLAAVTVGVFVLQRLGYARRRRSAGLSAPATSVLAVQAVVLALVLFLTAFYLYQASGVGWMFVFFVVLVLVANYALTKTSWGRNFFAVGGNREAARRSGIRVGGVYASAFITCSTLAAVGGLLAAGRLSSAATSSGGGDVNLNAIAAAVIGGTSLFGGRGSAFAALLGILVISSISSGLTLLNLDSSVRYMVTGAVVFIAVGLDALARRSRSSHGRA